MKIIKNLEDFKEINQNGFVATIGNFDGIHKGHQKILEILQNTGKRQNLSTVLITFNPHTKMFFGKNEDFLLTTLNEKIEILSKKLLDNPAPPNLSLSRLVFEIDYLLILDFDDNFKNLSPQRFCEEILINQINIKTLIIGANFTFGANKSGTIELLEKYNIFFQVIEIDLYYRCSSSLIRSFLKNKEIEKANQLLGYSFFIQGKVIHGKKNGTKLGFKTANIKIDNQKLVPLYGVYQVTIQLLNKQSIFYGIANIGLRPTIGFNEKPILEVHILNFNDEIYDELIKVEFIKFIREEKKFNSIEDLKEQINNDITTVIRLFE